MKKLVSNQISPNFTFSDAIHAALQMWRIGSRKNLNFAEFFGTKNYFLTNAARTGLGEIIKIVNPPKEKKIGIPAFICAVVATPFLEKGYQIEWIDTDKNGVIAIEDFVRKAENISMVVVPHVFGQPAPVEEIASIAKQKCIFVIEDCAHLLPSFEKGTGDEKFSADVRILSFGREKVLSCVSGGAVLWTESSPYAEKFQSLNLPYPSMLWTLRHIGQP
ncbi:DegT/DnrJ/EryC1/StrS family aminotransferase, partial [Candidatus Gracilibacteria bacterium]|nr:DegT/DnrJ/EryC1/StrS family aminotransferase [Candidatus Gracilibacteria bacterium]